jgi:beta-glucosidase
MSDHDLDARVDALIAGATLAEKVAMMSGRGFFAALKEDAGVWGARPYRAGSGIERLGIEPLYFTDGPRGVARGQSTCFPCSVARGATFDVDLERRIGEVMGIEARAQDCTLSGAVCINLLRHPAWGRAQESYGEDQHLLGAMGSALGTGIQAHGVIATVKHFALNSMENVRFTVDISVDERTLHEVYLPHFKACLDAGVGSVMSAYNKVNGEYCGQSFDLLTGILRHEWGFDGFVHSDWVLGVHKVYGASAGLDIENPEPLQWGNKLLSAVEDGHVAPSVIDTACRRILRTQLRFAEAQLPLENYTSDLVASPAHCALALEAAEKSAVLLENDGALPLSRDRHRRLAVLGRLAALENTGDNGSSRVRAPYVVTALEGLTALLGEDNIRTGDESDLAAARRAADDADAVVVVVGYTAEEEGEFIPGDLALGQAQVDLPPELIAARQNAPPRPVSIGGDRLDLGLPAEQMALIEAAAASGKPVIVVLVAGSAVMVEAWRDKASAILQTFYSGMEGGTALARLLFGEVSPSGKLPFTVARDPADYPPFDRDAEAITYGYWHGYALFDHAKRSPRYGFGHGLSYATFTYRSAKAQLADGRITISVAVRNDGAVSATEIVQAYVGFPGTVHPRPEKSLKAFARVTIAPGATRVVEMSIAINDLRYRDPAIHAWKVETGRHRILIGGSSAGPFVEAAVEL